MAVVAVERVAGLVQDGIGQWLPFVVEAQQSRDVDDAVVHVPPLGRPRHHVVKADEELVGPGHPPATDVDPGPEAELGALHRALQRSEPDLGADVEQ